MAAKRQRLVSSADAKPSKKQHTKPCGDCPWRKDALPGWLGTMTADEWVAAAHGEATIDCHTTIGPQCAGAAIYRRNVCKRMRNPDALVLPGDPVKVFTNPMAFKAHHNDKWVPEK